MSRSIWKGTFINSLLLKQLYFLKNIKSQSFVMPIWSRNSIILPNFLGLNVEVYNGERFIKLNINEEMINHKFGEYAFTKRMGRKIHPPVISKINKKKNKSSLKATSIKKSKNK